MSTEFENATNDIGDMQQQLELFMGTCQRCGRCFKEPGPLEQLMMKGYRLDRVGHGAVGVRRQVLSGQRSDGARHRDRAGLTITRDGDP